MAISPCPCMSLQRGSMMLAIVDVVISMINLGLVIVSLILYIRDDDDDDYLEDHLTESERRIGIIVMIVLGVICLLQVLLAIRLYRGAKIKDYRNCRVWLIVTFIVTIINIVNVILNFTGSELNGMTYGGTLFVILYKLYEMLVVYCFLRELTSATLQQNTGYAYPQPQYIHPQHVGGAPAYTTTVVYATPQSQEAYPMQQFSPYPAPATTIVNPSYPAPVHHVTTSGMNRV